MAGWLNKYIAFTEENEAPTVFHYWSAITVLAHILGRRVWLDRGYYMTYPGQMITILVGPSGSRKSTAVNLATGFLHDLGDANIVANKLSAQSLIDSLNRGMITENGISKPADSTGFAAAPELSVFLPKAGYVEEIVPLITDIFDAKPGPWRHRTRGTGLVELSNPLLTILSGSTPDWLQTNIPINAYGGGFMARMFLVWANEKKKLIPRPEKTPKLARMRLELLAELMWIKNNLSGEVKWMPDGEAWYDDFYIKWEKDKRKRTMNAFEEGYRNRRPEHLLRVAIVIGAAQTHSLELTAESLDAAHTHLLQLELHMGKCLEPAGQVTQIAANFAMVLSQLEKRGPQTKRELQRALWRYLSATDLSTALQTFVDSGMIDAEPSGNSVRFSLAGLANPEQDDPPSQTKPDD